MKKLMHDKERKPLVSVIMPVYNAQDFLDEAIKSILRQTYRNFEFIIVDDGSNDKSWKITRRYARLHPQKIKIYKLHKQTNYAGNGAVNYGFRRAKGEFIVRMDADDVALPKRLAKQVEFMRKNPDVILLGTQAYVIDKDGKITGKKNVPLTHEKIYDEYGVIHPVIHPSVMFRRSLLPQKDRIYERKFGINADYYTFFRFFKYGRFANMDEYLLKYRVHERNFSYKKPKERFFSSFKIRMFAIMDFDYKISVRSAFMMFLQLILILFLPERYIVPIYLAGRGMNSPREILSRKSREMINFFRQKSVRIASIF